MSQSNTGSTGLAGPSGGERCGRAGEGKPLPGRVLFRRASLRAHVSPVSGARKPGAPRGRGAPGFCIRGSACAAIALRLEGVDGATGLRVEDAPVDELLGQVPGGLVVDDRE